MTAVNLLIAVQAAAAGNWTFAQSVDPVTDFRTATALVRTFDGQDRLVVRCDGAGEPVVSVQFITGRYLGGSSERSVTVRFDQAPPVTTDWEYTSKGVFIRDEKKVTALAKLIAKSERVFIRAYNYEDQPVDGEFFVTGGGSVIRQVFDACNYPWDRPVKAERG